MTSTMKPVFRTAAELVAQCLRDDPTFGLMTPAEQRAEARMLMTKVEGCDPDDLDVQMEALTLACQPRAEMPVTRMVDTGRKRIAVAAPRLDAHEGSVDLGAQVAADTVTRPVAPPSAPAVAFAPQMCRNTDGCTERLGATGRCMDCGAQRRAPPAPLVAQPASGVVETKKPDPVFNKPPRIRKSRAKKPAKRVKTAVDVVALRKAKGEQSTPAGFARKRNRLMTGGIMERTKALTNAPDHYLAKLIDRSRPTVQAYLQGRIVPVLNAWQVNQLRELLEQQKLAIDDVLDELGAMLHETQRMKSTKEELV